MHWTERLRGSHSTAEAELAMALQRLQNSGKITDVGRSDYRIPVRITMPDRVWKLADGRKIALYLDGEAVHDPDDAWDREAEWALRKQGWIVLRERYTRVTKSWLAGVVAKVVAMGI